MKRLLLLFALFASVAGAQTSGTISAVNGAVVLPLPSGTTTVNVKISGSFIASVSAEQSSDGNTWVAVGTLTSPSSVTYSVSVAMGSPTVTEFRARAASYLSGIINVTLTPGSGSATPSGATNISITNLPIATFPATQPVSGTVNVGNFPATQPVSIAGTVPISVPGTVPVTGVFFQATQPISGTVGVNNFPATQPVSGVFWQATQPVSLSSVPTHAVTQSGAWNVAVSNFPATQPVSGSVNVGNFPATQPVSIAVLPSVAVNNFPATQPVSVSALPLPSGASQDRTTAAAPTAVRLTDGAAFYKPTTPSDTQPVSIAVAPTTPVTAPTITKGTQGANGFATQDLKDSGRSYRIFTLDRVAGVTSEALATMTINSAGTVTTGTSYTVTSGKTLRLQAFCVSVRPSSAVVASARVRVRSAASVSTSSGILLLAELGGNGATAENANEICNQMPDGVEIAAGQQIGISQLANATTATISVNLVGFEY